MLTQARLKELLHYCPDTGAFTWRINRGRNAKVGQIAGTFNRGYVMIKIDGKSYGAHRLACLYSVGKLPEEVDHSNGDKSDNKLNNLLFVDHAKNMKNLPKQKRNKTGVTGVGVLRGYYQANIRVNRKLLYLGFYADFFEAVCARKSAELKYNFHPNHGR